MVEFTSGFFPHGEGRDAGLTAGRQAITYKTKGVNTLPKVTLRSDESQEQLLRRFSREVVKSRLLTDVRRKRWFVSKSELNRIAKKKAARRTRKTQKEQQTQGV